MIKFIDMFSGVGGFPLGLKRAGGYECVWSCDWDFDEEGKKSGYYANRIYTKHFGEENHFVGDIREIVAGEIPDHDLLCAGFPCQSFSLAGERKGFEDTRGTLFYEVCRIAKAKRPKVLLLENVRGLLSNDKGATFGIILESLSELGYLLEWQVLNSRHWGVPQNRPRVFIIGHLGGRGTREILPITGDDRKFIKAPEEAQGERARVRIANTLSARYYKDGAENLIGKPLVIQTAHIHPDRWGNWIKEREYTDTLDGAGSIGVGEPIAVELAHTKANMRAGRFSDVVKTLDGGKKMV